MLVAIGDSLSDLARSDDGEDGEDDDNEDSEQGKLSEDDEPNRVMGTINETVQQNMEKFRQNLRKLDESSEPGCDDAADNFCQMNKKYDTSELRVPAVVQPQMDHDAPAPPPPSFGALMECLEIVPGISQMPQGTS